MEPIMKRKAQRKEGIQLSYRRQAIKDYHLWDRSAGRPIQRGPFWDITKGAWEDRLPENAPLVAAHIYPQMLGLPIFRSIFGNEHHFYDLWGSRNCLLLPTSVAEAFDEWAITVVPNIPEDATLEQRKAWVASEIKDYKFRVLDPENWHLNQKISHDEKLGKDLDQERLHFRETSSLRPSVKYLYFWHCCAIMSKNYRLFHDLPPAEYLERMRDSKREKLLRRIEDSDPNILSGADIRSRTEFWHKIVRELALINEDPDFLLDWSMDLENRL